MASSGRPLGSMIIELDMTSTKFEDSLKSIQNQFRLAKSEMKANLSVLDTTGTAYEKASSKVDELSKLMEVNERKISALKDRYDAAVKTNGEYSDSAMKVANQLNKAEAQQAQYQRQLDNSKVAMKDAERGTDSYREALARVQKQTKVEVDSLQTQGKQTEANVVKYRSLGKEVDNYSKIIASERSKLQDLVLTKGDDAKETQDQRVKIAELNTEQEKSQYQYDQLGKKVKNFSTGQAQSIDSLNKVSSKLNAVGGALKDAGSTMTTRFTVPIVAGMGYAVKSATDFSSQIATIRPLLITNGDSVKQVRKEIVAMSDDSKKWAIQYGISTTSINDGMAELVRRGYSAEQTMGAMPSILNATKASGDDFNSVMKVSTSTLEQFGLKSNSTSGMLKNTQRVTDSLTYTANATAAGFQDMGDAMTYVGPTAHAAGISLEETASAIGLMSNQGIEGSVAGTALRSALTRLLKPSKQNAAGMKELGINAEDFKNHALTLPQIINKIRDNTQGWTKEQKASAIATAFGTEAQAGMNALISQGGDALTDLTTKTEKATGSTKKIADTMNQTTSANMNKFKESLNVMTITIGSKLLPSITPLIKKLTDLISSFSKLSPGTKDFIVKAALITAALGPVLMVLGQLVTLISGIISVVTFLIANPIVAVIAAIAAIGVGLYEAYQHIKPFHDAVNNLFNSLKTFFVNIGKWFAELPGKIQSGFSGISKWVGQIPNKFKSAFSGMTNWGSQLVSGLKKSWSNVTSVTSKWVDDFKKVGKKILDALVGALKGFGKLAVYALALPVGIAVLITKPLIGPMKSLMKSLVNNIKAIWTPFSAWFKNLWIGISNTWHVTMTAISNWFKSIMTGISNIWRSSWTNISNFFKPILSSIGNFFRSTFNGIRSFFTGVMNSISNIASSAMNGISSAWNVSLSAISSFFKGIFNGIKGFIGPIMSGISNVISSALNSISSTWSKMWQGMEDFFGGIWSGIKKAASDGINGVLGVINTGVDAIDSVWKFFTGKKTSVPHLGKVHFEQGGVVEQHLSVINDGKGSNWKELVQLPDGNLMMSHQRNWTGMLPAGTRIYNGDETKGIMNAVGIQKYAKGGIVGSIESAGSGLINWAKGSLENVGSWIGDKFEALSKFMEHPIENTKALMTSAGNKVLPKVEAYANFAKGALDKTAGKAGDWVKDHISDVMDKMMASMGGSGKSMPAKAYGSMIRAAAAYMHQSITDFNVDMIERIIGNESGGNPRAINLTDSNAQAGHPSKGILQYIDQTFRYYAMPGFTDIWNPLHQLIALFNDSTWRSDMGMGYNGKYGEWRGNASGPSGPKLMAAGGLITQATNAIIGEVGPEIVLPLTNQTRAMHILSQAQAVMGNGNIYSSNNVDTSMLEENQKQQTLLMQIQNKLLSKILEILTNGGGSSDDQSALNSLYSMMDKLGLKDRKITKYQMG
ncbi:phage tail tape measure protein [Companilactobacillus crustorum]|uniref:phage tail tape measure protein n=1 Tax=Companilactobacillus crustorum TaxID=392416 RepID=UPI00237EE2C6|nr:phage tail tape measure protein [Companilactobacillus crustorum]WDT66106.1 phage tail tape measure protein [Companilactobacillus crustorum]